MALKWVKHEVYIKDEAEFFSRHETYRDRQLQEVYIKVDKQTATIKFGFYGDDIPQIHEQIPMDIEIDIGDKFWVPDWSDKYGTDVDPVTGEVTAYYDFDNWGGYGGKQQTAYSSGHIMGKWTRRENHNVIYEVTAPYWFNPPEVPATQSCSVGKEVEIPSYPESKDDYYFSGWKSTDVTIKDGKFEMPDKDVKLTGEWKLKDYPRFAKWDDSLKILSLAQPRTESERQMMETYMSGYVPYTKQIIDDHRDEMTEVNVRYSNGLDPMTAGFILDPDVRSLFKSSPNLGQVRGRFNAMNVTGASFMFAYCPKLMWTTDLEYGLIETLGMNVSYVDISYMFHDSCTNSIMPRNISIGTSHYNDFTVNMAMAWNGVGGVGVESFSWKDTNGMPFTGKPITLNGTFGVTKLKTIDLSEFSSFAGDSSQYALNGLFASSTDLEHIYVNDMFVWDVETLQSNGEDMFWNCTKLPNYVGVGDKSMAKFVEDGGYLERR